MVIKPFRFIGGALCLDFVNTVGGWTDGGVVRDKLRGPEDLARWGEIVGNAPALTPWGWKSVFRKAISLRSALHEIFQSAIERRAPADEHMEILNRVLKAARTHERIAFVGREFRREVEDSPDAILWAVALSAEDLLTSDMLRDLRQCPGVDCGWMFLDASRNGLRQWCDMRICGNRAKARAFREKQRKHYSRGFR